MSQSYSSPGMPFRSGDSDLTRSLLRSPGSTLPGMSEKVLPPAQAAAKDASLDELLDRVRSQIHRGPNDKDGGPAGADGSGVEFIPIEPQTFRESQLQEGFVEGLVMKFLLSCGAASGREASDQAKLPFLLIDELLRQMKTDQLVVHRGSAPAGDYVYQLTDLGRERARRLSEHCTYFGAAPVSLRDYIASVTAQSLVRQKPTQEDLKRAFHDLQLSEAIYRRIGPAVNSGRGMFLFGAPGNGKSSIAERVTRAFGDFIWIPRSVIVDGEIMRLFDPSNHEAAPNTTPTGLVDNQHIDRRWIRIRRPTIIAGGELTMQMLEVTFNTSTGISEAPLQMKSNCGTLVIDDFGRQRMPVDELLNRWIVPLEKRYDYLNMPNGKKIQVPFDQLIIFSTNLQPRDLVDDAFLRRIPYKIDVCDPTEEEFRLLFQDMAPKLGFEFDAAALDYLIDAHYRPIKRPYRCCQPRDLLMQVRNFCQYMRIPLEMKGEYFDRAVESYFAVM
ncbi:MAG: AAA family ATPase [Planctomycetes bacterium]|nr:AAA family ATPase [Planctomycetota bacterium]